MVSVIVDDILLVSVQLYVVCIKKTKQNKAQS